MVGVAPSVRARALVVTGAMVPCEEPTPSAKITALSLLKAIATWCQLPATRELLANLSKPAPLDPVACRLVSLLVFKKRHPKASFQDSLVANIVPYALAVPAYLNHKETVNWLPLFPAATGKTTFELPLVPGRFKAFPNLPSTKVARLPSVPE